MMTDRVAADADTSTSRALAPPVVFAVLITTDEFARAVCALNSASVWLRRIDDRRHGAVPPRGNSSALADDLDAIRTIFGRAS